MSRWKDRLKGGRADALSPECFPKRALREGASHEMEHTTDRQLATEIAMDHLSEDAEYYKKLKQVEKNPMRRSRAYKKAHRQMKKWEKRERKAQAALKKASAQADRWKKKCDQLR